MARRSPVALGDISFFLADSILNASDCDRVSAGSGLFWSRRFRELLEQNRPENLMPHDHAAHTMRPPGSAGGNLTTDSS